MLLYTTKILWELFWFLLFLNAFGFACGRNVTYDGRSLIINGNHKILFSGSIHYPRSTPEVFIYSFCYVYCFCFFSFFALHSLFSIWKHWKKSICEGRTNKKHKVLIHEMAWEWPRNFFREYATRIAQLVPSLFFIDHPCEFSLRWYTILKDIVTFESSLTWYTVLASGVHVYLALARFLMIQKIIENMKSYNCFCVS